MPQLRSPSDSGRYKLVSEVASAHSDVGSHGSREAARTLASMRGPLVDLEPDGCNSGSRQHGDLLVWENADVLHQQRQMPRNSADIQPNQAVSDRSSLTVLTQMVNNLTQTMETFRCTLSGITPMQVQHTAAEPKEVAAAELVRNKASPQAEVKASQFDPTGAGSSSFRKNVMKPQLYDGKEPINSFLAHFEVCAQFNGWSTTDKLAWLQWSLKGRAQQVLWDMPSSMMTLCTLYVSVSVPNTRMKCTKSSCETGVGDQMRA